MSVRSRRLLALPVAVAAIAFIAWPGGSAQPAAQADKTPSMPSSSYWLGAGEKEGALPESSASIYQGANDQNFLKLINQANALPRYKNTVWKSAGPVGGVQSIPEIGSGAELFGAVGGIGTAIAVDPSDTSGNTAYLGTHGGLWKTTDGGKTLTELSSNFLRAPVGAIAVDPTNPKNVYVGTGVAVNTLSDDQVGAGMYVSHDAGKTFVRPGVNTRGYGVNTIVVSPTTGHVLAGTNFGLWRSTDHGGSFV
jgi:hypothetical protein